MNFFDGKRVLITGAGGYIAYNLFQALREIPCTIIGLTGSDPATVSLAPGATANITLVKTDLSRRQAWEDHIDGVDVIFHLAAQTSVYESNMHPKRDLEINVLPLLDLLEVCKTKKNCPTIIYAGTVTEAGIPISLPVGESHPDNPITIYDLHKLVAENYLKHYTREGLVKGAVLRLANVYGPGPKSSRKDRGILNQMIAKALRGEHLTIYGDGNYIRDYIYITDVVNAFLAAAEHIGATNGGHFVIGSGRGITIREAFATIASRVKAERHTSVDVLHVEEPANLSAIEKRNFVADSSKFESLARWKAKTNLAEGIDQTIAWYLEN